MEDTSLIKDELLASGQPFLLDKEEERTDEYAHFYFMANHDGRMVLADAAVYTLRMNHESELFEIAEERVIDKYSWYKKLRDAEALTEEQEEEVGMFMAEIIMDLEEDQSVKVKEHVEVETINEETIGLDVGLNREVITDQVILKFIEAYNNDNLQLDETLYAFQSGDYDDE